MNALIERLERADLAYRSTARSRFPKDDELDLLEVIQQIRDDWLHPQPGSSMEDILFAWTRVVDEATSGNPGSRIWINRFPSPEETYVFAEKHERKRANLAQRLAEDQAEQTLEMGRLSLQGSLVSLEGSEEGELIIDEDILLRDDVDLAEGQGDDQEEVFMDTEDTLQTSQMQSPSKEKKTP